MKYKISESESGRVRRFQFSCVQYALGYGRGFPAHRKPPADISKIDTYVFERLSLIRPSVKITADAVQRYPGDGVP